MGVGEAFVLCTLIIMTGIVACTLIDSGNKIESWKRANEQLRSDNHELHARLDEYERE